MPPIGPSGVQPAWGWPDAVVGLVLAVCLWALVTRTAARLRGRAASSGWTRVAARMPDQVPVGIGLVLALTVTLLVRGQPAGQIVVGAVAVALVLVAGPVRPRVGPGDGWRSR